MATPPTNLGVPLNLKMLIDLPNARQMVAPLFGTTYDGAASRSADHCLVPGRGETKFLVGRGVGLVLIVRLKPDVRER